MLAVINIVQSLQITGAALFFDFTWQIVLLVLSLAKLKDGATLLRLIGCTICVSSLFASFLNEVSMPSGNETLVHWKELIASMIGFCVAKYGKKDSNVNKYCSAGIIFLSYLVVISLLVKSF
jgi:hypothetical protein